MPVLKGRFDPKIWLVAGGCRKIFKEQTSATGTKVTIQIAHDWWTLLNYLIFKF
jgi:hypothetical protein